MPTSSLKLVLSINDTSDKSTNKVLKDIDKKSNLHSNMIEDHSNLIYFLLTTILKKCYCELQVGFRLYTFF